MRAWDIRGYAYDAALHCPACARARFGARALADGTARDADGNDVHPVFESDEADPAGEYCDDCHEELSEPCDVSPESVGGVE